MTSVSPLRRWTRSLSSSGRAVSVPDATSVKVRTQPALVSASVWSARSWSVVETRALADEVTHVGIVSENVPAGSALGSGDRRNDAEP